MRVLVVHNRYSSRVPSGENLAVDDEVRWLRQAGVDVHVHQADNDELIKANTVDRLRHAAESVWSLSAQRGMTSAIEAAKPDIVHIHNLFPLLTASVQWTADRHDLRVVWTAHNYRLTCVIGTHHREGNRCDSCKPGWRIPGVRYGCYGGSMATSGLVTAATSLFGRMAKSKCVAIAPSENMHRWLVDQAGFASGRVRLKYNGVDRPKGQAVIPSAVDNRTFLFAGYLTDYKGVGLLLEAWRRTGSLDAELRILGDGPLAGMVESAAAADARITWSGSVPASEVAGHLAEARAVVIPSTWEEPFGRTAAEAMAYGRPIITSGLGALSEIVDERSGWITGAKPQPLADAIVAAAGSDAAVDERSQAAAARYAQLFSPEVTTHSLIDIYEDVLRE
ncbi:MAG TPA: glycosyltransferase family 4 protein [Acidimicrobiales bacterium]|jgi:glycosyltransferase involved in cell wall biosynthesis